MPPKQGIWQEVIIERKCGLKERNADDIVNFLDMFFRLLVLGVKVPSLLAGVKRNLVESKNVYCC